METSHNQYVGRKGEQVAAKYLQSIGYKLYKRNSRLRRNEVDIIAYDPEDKVVVFAEIKTRSTSHKDYQPELGLTFAKKKNLFRFARRWIARKDYDRGYRVDLLCVVGREVVQHVKEISY